MIGSGAEMRLKIARIEHTDSNKHKGNTPEVAEWRHPTPPRLTVVNAEDGRVFVQSRQPTARTDG